MKNFITLIIVCLSISAQAQFTADKVAVIKISGGGSAIIDDGSALGTNAILRPVDIVQFNTTGTAQTGTVITTFNSTGTDPKLTLESRRLAHEGHLTLSGDRNYLTLVGYNVAAGLLATSGTPNGRSSEKRVARIGASGVADITTNMPTPAVYNGDGVKGSVTADGSTFIITGTGATATKGAQSIGYGTNTATSFLAKDFRGVGYFANNFFGYSSAGTIEGAGQTITGLSTDGTQFVFLNADPAVDWGGTGLDLLYLADRNSGVRKFYYNGSTWVAAGVAGFIAVAEAPAGGVQEISGRIEGGKPTLYITKAIVSASTYQSSHLIKMVDIADRTVAWDLAAAPPAAATFPNTTLLASTNNTERFIGVALTPGSSAIIIPVELMTFKGSLINDKAALQWETASERNAKEFIVEKSTDAKAFAAIGTVAAKNTAQKSSYDFDDTKLSEDINYYRLKMVDFDGSFKYSNTVAIKLGGKSGKGVSVFPNPIANTLTISHTEAAEGAEIRIVALNGSIVAQFKVAKNATQTSLDASQFPAGQYFINYSSKGTSVTTSFVK